MEVTWDHKNGGVTIRATTEEALLMAEGLYAVESTSRSLAQDPESGIDGRDRAELMRDVALAGSMRADIEGAVDGRGLTMV